MSNARPRLVIGNKNYSSWSLRPWLLLREAGIEVDEVRVPLDTPEFEERIGALSPTRRVPALHHDGLVISDSLAICEYANERWLQGSGWPSGLRERALARAAAAEMHSGFAALRSQLPMNCRRQPDDYRWDSRAQADIDRIQQLWRDLRALHEGQGKFLCGAFGIVDAMFAPVVVRFEGYGVRGDDTASDYMAAVRSLPSLRRWCEDAACEREVIESEERHNRSP